MAEIIVEKHVIASPNEPPAGSSITTAGVPVGAVDLIIWGDGQRLRLRMHGAEGVNIGASVILAAGEAMRMAAQAAQVNDGASRILNGAGGRS